MATLDELPIGQFVKKYVPAILGYCAANPDELKNLTDAHYARETFRTKWPFFAEAANLSDKASVRFWKEVHQCSDKRLRVCSQWFAHQRPAFATYLSKIGVIDTPRTYCSSTN